MLAFVFFVVSTLFFCNLTLYIACHPYKATKYGVFCATKRVAWVAFTQFRKKKHNRHTMTNMNLALMTVRICMIVLFIWIQLQTAPRFCTRCLLHIAIFRLKKMCVNEEERCFTHSNFTANKLWCAFVKIEFLFIILSCARAKTHALHIVHDSKKENKNSCQKRKDKIVLSTTILCINYIFIKSFCFKTQFVARLCIFEVAHSHNCVAKTLWKNAANPKIFALRIVHARKDIKSIFKNFLKRSLWSFWWSELEMDAVQSWNHHPNFTTKDWITNTN